MPRATIADYQNRGLADELEQLCGTDGNGDLIAAPFDAAALQADHLIDRYVLGFSDAQLADPVLGDIAFWLVRYALYQKNGAPDHVIRDQKNAMAMLAQIQAGDLLLGDVAGATSPDMPQIIAPDGVFSGCGMDGY
jgi:phage gp36-like protein